MYTILIRKGKNKLIVFIPGNCFVCFLKSKSGSSCHILPAAMEEHLSGWNNFALYLYAFLILLMSMR